MQLYYVIKHEGIFCVEPGRTNKTIFNSMKNHEPYFLNIS